MAISPFFFSSENLPRLKAKQLAKVFPSLKLSVAQEATARALGYPSWYECTKKGGGGKRSLSDEEAGIPVRVGRYYHQAGVLVSLGISPKNADLWVRSWGLTGKPTLAPEEGVPLYFRWLETIEQLERGEITEDHAREMWDDPFSKYPEIDRPQRVCPGVIVGPCLKYPHYALDPVVTAAIPWCLRGPHSHFHLEDDTDVLMKSVPGFPKNRGYESRIKSRLSPVQHEWIYGKPRSRSKELVIPKLVAAAMANPEAMVIISQRHMPPKDGEHRRGRCAIACLRGKDFAAFLLSKGAIDPDTVVWYRNVDDQRILSPWDMQPDWVTGEAYLPVFFEAHEHQPSLPLYSYPFKVAPMHEWEYTTVYEQLCLLPLDEDYPDNGEDDDDDGDGFDDDPWGPVPLLEEALQE